MRLYRDRDWLYQKYVIEQLSTCKIAELCQVTPTPIWYWLHKHKIKVRTLSNAHQLKTLSEEHKQAISRKLKGRPSPMKGRKQTAHFREVMRARMSGKNHPMYGRTREKAPMWKGGRRVCSKGYVYLYLKRENNITVFRAEHRLIAEKVLGRELRRNETVHHINGNCSDNRNANLLICTRSFHGWLHRKIQLIAKEVR